MFLYRVLSQGGRLPVDIDEIVHLRALHYTWTKIAALIHIPGSTLYRRLSEAGVSSNDYTPLCNEELDDLFVV